MRSLFILSLPRSLSTEVHRACCDILPLQGPAWTTAGEILNLDRFVLQGGRNSAFPKYIQPHSPWFGGTMEFLDHAYVADGFCYKDVVQPFVVSAWLRQGPVPPVLKIKPNIAHVAFAMLQRKWLYPTVVGRQTGTVPAMMVEGLLLAEAALDGVPGAVVSFDELVADFSVLEAALAPWSGGAASPVVLPADVERRRDEILARRSLDLYKHLQELECEGRRRMARGGTAPARVAFPQAQVA